MKILVILVVRSNSWSPRGFGKDSFQPFLFTNESERIGEASKMEDATAQCLYPVLKLLFSLVDPTAFRGRL